MPHEDKGREKHNQNRVVGNGRPKLAEDIEEAEKDVEDGGQAFVELE